jgi:hypothetical protein
MECEADTMVLTRTGYDEARQLEPKVNSWTFHAENAALNRHILILEDGRILPRKSGAHAEVGGEVQEGMSAEGCAAIEDSMISGREGGLDTISGAESGTAGIVSKPRVLCGTVRNNQ